MIRYNMTDINNLNTNFDNNFEEAFGLCDKEFSHNELLYMLNNGNLIEKQIAALKFDYVEGLDDAIALVSNLTGCDGKIREAVAQTINRFITDKPDTGKFFAETNPEIFANASIDINGNICSLIVQSVEKLKTFEKFRSMYLDKIIKISKNTLDEIDKFIFRDKKYVINKQIFKLYWCLKAINNLKDFADKNDLVEILERSMKQREYTIRECVAHIVKDSDGFESFKSIIMQDENYYVRNALN